MGYPYAFDNHLTAERKRNKKINDAMEKYSKAYIKVDAQFQPDGRIVPTAIYWIGQRYPVDAVLDSIPLASTKVGGIGLQYTVRIGGRERKLFLEYATASGHTLRWFVESKTPEPPDFAE